MSEAFQVTEVDRIPDMVLLPYSNVEFKEVPEAARDAMVRASDKVWQVAYDGKVLMVLGVMSPALIGAPPELWLLVSAAFNKNLTKNLRHVRGRVDELLSYFPHLRVRIEDDFTEGQRFARFFGFRDTGRLSQVLDKTYHWYEV
jgi:hypothetical protein